MQHDLIAHYQEVNNPEISFQGIKEIFKTREKEFDDLYTDSMGLDDPLKQYKSKLDKLEQTIDIAFYVYNCKKIDKALLKKLNERHQEMSVIINAAMLDLNTYAQEIQQILKQMSE